MDMKKKRMFSVFYVYSSFSQNVCSDFYFNYTIGLGNTNIIILLFVCLFYFFFKEIYFKRKPETTENL